MTEPFGLSPAFLDRGSSSFAEFVQRTYPQLLAPPEGTPESDIAPHGTTIVAVKHSGGVILAGDKALAATALSLPLSSAAVCTAS